MSDFKLHSMAGFMAMAAPALALFIGVVGCGETILGQVGDTSGTLGVDLGQIAVITGDFEDVGAALDTYFVDYDLYDGYLVGGDGSADLPTVEGLLADPALLYTYNTLYFSCGARGTGVVDPRTLLPSSSILNRPDMLSNLRDFVQAGGVIYVADQSYGLIEAAMPELLDFHGVDGQLGAALVGASGTYLASAALDAPFERTQGIDIEVNLGHQWAAAWPGAHTWLDADVYLQSSNGSILFTPNTALLSGVRYGSGLIVFSSVHNDPPRNQPESDLQIDLFRAMGGAQ